MGPGDEEFLADLRQAFEGVVRSVTPVEAYGAAGRAAQIGHEWVHLGKLAAGAYTFWSEVADVYELREVTGIPEEGWHIVAMNLAHQWLSTPTDALDDFLANTTVGLLEMVTRAGFTVREPDLFREQPWRGRWANLVWSIEHVDVTHSPYAAAQRVLQDLQTEPVLWETGHGARLVAHCATGTDTRRNETASMDSCAPICPPSTPTRPRPCTTHRTVRREGDRLHPRSSNSPPRPLMRALMPHCGRPPDSAAALGAGRGAGGSQGAASFGDGAAGEGW